MNYEELRQNIEFNYIFKTNNHGLRYHDIPENKPVKSRRVFVSGDSFTEGVGIEDGRRFSDLLENQFRSGDTRILFINGGLAGTGPLEYGKTFLDIGLTYKPDALLLCIFVNDVANTPEKLSQKTFNPRVSRSGFKKIIHTLWPHLYTQLNILNSQLEYRNKTRTTDFVETISEQAKKRNIPQSRINQWKKSLPRKLVTAVNQGVFNGSILSYGLLYPEYWTESIDISSSRAKSKWKNMTNILTEILARSKENGVETAILLIPTSFQYDKKSHDKNNPWVIAGSTIKKKWLSEESEIQRKMRHWTASKGVAFLDLTPVFREAIKSNNNLNWELDGHWNPSGHQVAANAISTWLISNKVFSFINDNKQQ